ncbi:AAA family ATPase, partial [Enterococcus faecalis]
MTKTITFGNFKGGVGKTMTSVMTALNLSLNGNKVLFIDFDPQGNASDVLAKTFNITYKDKPSI